MKKDMNFGTALLILVLFFALFIGFIYYVDSLPPKPYVRGPYEKDYSVQVDIVDAKYYQINKDTAIFDKDNNAESKLLHHIIRTYDGNIYVYNDYELLCVSTPERRKYNTGFDVEGAYKEIQGNKLVFYTKNIVGIRSGGRLITYYREKECSNIYHLIKKES